MEDGFQLPTMAQQLQQKKAQVEASVQKILMEVRFNMTDFYDYLLKRMDILAVTRASIPNPDLYFKEEISKACALFQIPLVHSVNDSFNLRDIFPFLGENLANIPATVNPPMAMENFSLQVVVQKLREKKMQVEASVQRLQMEARFNMTDFYDYLLKRMDILAAAGASIPDHGLYLGEEIAKASTIYQMPLEMAVNEAFNLQAIFAGANQPNNFADQTENAVNSGTVVLLEEDEIKSEYFSDEEDVVHQAEAERQPTAEQTVPPAPRPENPNQPSAFIKREIDDNHLAVVLYQPQGNHVDPEPIEEQYNEENNVDADAISDEENFDEESDHFEEQVNMSDDEDDEENEEVDDDTSVNEEDSNDDTMDETNFEEDGEESMSDSDESHQEGEGEENREDSSMDDSNEDEDVEEEEEPTVQDISEPSTSTGRRSVRISARVSQASSSKSQDRQATRPVSKRQMVPGQAATGVDSESAVTTGTLSVVTKKLNCTVPGCKKAVQSKKALNRHLLSSHQLKEYRCLVRRCHGKVSTSFSTKSQLADHFRKAHRKVAKWTCKCSKIFKSYRKLGYHYRAYHELGHFACSVEDCPFKPTTTRIKVQNHQRNHREAKYECPVDDCDSSFKMKYNLDQHILIHTRERPFPCPECDKSFARQSSLTVHLRIHRNDKCYRCTWSQCTYSSSDYSAVIKHIRTVHFKLPRTKEQQTEVGIIDDRDPREFLAKD